MRLNSVIEGLGRTGTNLIQVAEKLMGKKKKKKQANIDSSQLAKGGIVCAAVIGVIYFFNSLGGGGASSSSTVSLVAPQNHGQHVGQVQPKVAPKVENHPEQIPAVSTPDAIPVQPDNAKSMVEEAARAIKEKFAEKNKPDAPAASASQIPAEMLQVEIPETPLELPDLLERINPSLVKLTFLHSTGKSVGAGFIVSQSGLLITSLHSLEGIRGAYADFFDGSSAVVEGYRLVNPQYNIAVLQIEPPENGLKLLPLTDQLPLQETSVVAFGPSSQNATEGKITGILSPNKLQSVMRLPFIGSWLETSIPVLPTFSGGPVVNKFGQVIAVNMIQLTNTEEQNLALAAKDVLQLINASRNQEVVKLTPDTFAGFNSELKKKMAKDIAGTDRGTELLAAITQVGVSQDFQSSFDSSGIIKEIVNKNVERSLSKSDLELLLDEPGENAPTLLVTLNAEPQRIRTKDSLKVSVQAKLIAIDPMENPGNKFVILWKGEKSDIGTVLPEAISPEMTSRILGPKLKSYFDKFRTAQSKAKRLAKQNK